jgi:hypothetical protein
MKNYHQSYNCEIVCKFVLNCHYNCDNKKRKKNIGQDGHELFIQAFLHISLVPCSNAKKINSHLLLGIKYHTTNFSLYFTKYFLGHVKIIQNIHSPESTTFVIGQAQNEFNTKEHLQPIYNTSLYMYFTPSQKKHKIIYISFKMM